MTAYTEGPVYSRDELLSLDPTELHAAPAWNVMLAPRSHHVADYAMMQRRAALALDTELGIAADHDERARAHAAVAVLSVVGIDGERLRLRAVQAAIREGCCAWHAISIATGTVDRCPCRPCAEVQP